MVEVGAYDLLRLFGAEVFGHGFGERADVAFHDVRFVARRADRFADVFACRRFQQVGVVDPSAFLTVASLPLGAGFRPCGQGGQVACPVLGVVVVLAARRSGAACWFAWLFHAVPLCRTHTGRV